MKTLVHITLVAFLTHFTAQAQKEISTPSEIEEVTVFLQGAQINRIAGVNLTKGSNIVKLTGLSNLIDLNSIKVEGSNAYTIVSVNYQTNYLAVTQDLPEFKSLKTQKENLELEMLVIANDKRILDEERNMLYANQTVKGTQEALNIEKLVDYADLYQDRLIDINIKYNELIKREKERQQRQSKINQQLAELERANNKTMGEIIVNLSANTTGRSVIKFSYVVNAAKWYPAYDIRSKDAGSPLEIHLRSKISQWTGEEWKDVTLKLSTGNPTIDNTQPDLYTWELNAHKEQPVSDSKRKYRTTSNPNFGGTYNATVTDQNAAVAEQTKEEYDKLENESNTLQFSSVKPGVTSTYTLNGITDLSTSSSMYTTVVQGQNNIEYNITIPYTIPSDAKEYDVDIQTYTLNPLYNYYSAPKFDKDAFLIAQLLDWEQYNLMPGYANIYYQGSFVGSTYFNTQSTNDTLNLSLGRDKSVIIERKKTKDYAKTQVVGTQQKTTMAIEINIRNTKSKPVTLELEDQIPTSAIKEINIDLLEDGGAKYKKETGALTWKIELGAGETKTIKFSYEVKYPKDKQISNL